MDGNQVLKMNAHIACLKPNQCIMKNLASILRWSLMTLAAFAFSSASAQMFWNEDFEADNAGVTYTLSTSDGLQFSDGSNDFFTQIPSNSVSGGYVVTGQNNTGYFAAQDIDGQPTGGSPLEMFFDDVSIAGESNLELRMLVAEDDSGDGNEDWDAGDKLRVEVDIDNSGTFTTVMIFANDGATFNTEPGFDANLDGVFDGVEGAALTDTFAEFTAAIAGTGSVIDIRIVFEGLNAADEDVAIDYIQLWNASVPTIPGCTDSNACNFDNTANQNDGSCFFVGDACDDGDANTVNDTVQGDCGCAGTVVCTPAPMWTAAEVVTNNGFNANGAWETIAGGFSVNGFCGGGCQEAVDTWIVSNGFDFTGVAAAELVFDAAENFGTTDLDLQYTTSYNGDPAASSWTSLLVVSTGDSYVVDLSALNGLTEVYFGFQYLDDGADGYSDWEVTAIEIIGDCPAPVAAFDCPVEMANIGDACDDGDANTTGDVIQGDCSCAGTVICTPAPMWTAAEVVTNNGFNANGAWETIAGGFSVNGFCGGGCQEAVDTWIVSNGFDFTGVAAAELVFDAAENFGTTDLDLQYTTSYNGDPAASSWTSLLVVSTGDSYVVDLSALNGLTEVYFGFQYLDDGADGYSDWEVTAIEIIGDCPAPVAAFDCPVEMANIGDACDDGDANTTGDTIQGDCSCAGTPAPSNDCSLFFSEYAEGSSNNKYFEIYNPTDAAISLDGYAFPNVVNDPSVVGEYENWNTFPAGAVVAAGDVYVVAHGSADPAILAEADHTFNSLSNGDDGFALVEGTEMSYVIVDWLGNWDGDPGSGWAVAGVNNATQDAVLVRKSTINSGNDDWFASAGTDANDSEWIVEANEDWSDLGMHTFTGTCGAPVSGCTTEAACNYDPSATIDDGSCLFPGDVCDDGDANTVGDVFGGDCSCAGVALPGDVVISEIHYNPNDDLGFTDANYEFVEIYNNSGAPLDLEGWSFGGVNYTFPAGASLAAGEYAIVAFNPAFYTGNGYQVFGPYTGGLSNGGETVTLFDDLANTVDEVPYDDGGQWPIGADGEGYSLELIDLTSDNTFYGNWQTSCPINGTPGLAVSSHPCDAAPTATTIVSIQSNVDAEGGSLDTGNVVEVSGIVTGTFAGSTLFSLQDGTGAHSGIWVEGDGVAEGDQITVQGTVLEWFDLTIIAQAVITVNTQGNALPAPEVLGTFAINDEQWEGVLVETTGDVSNGDAGFGEWIVDDLTGDVRVDDLNGVAVTPLVVGDTYTVTGPLYFSFGNFKIEPRDNAQDIRKWGCTDSNFLNFDPDAVIDDGNCGNTLGCTDSEADNFDPAADADDGSCEYSGCTDDTALNYDPQATIDDSSCYFTLPNLVLNEIHYNPCTDQGDDSQWEFFEIYNAEATSVDISGYVISQGIDFTFWPGTTIAAGEYIIVAYDSTSYTGNGYQVFQWLSGGLSNNGETLELSDAFGNVVDAVPFDDASPWPTSPDGNCASLELIDPALDNSLPENWQASFVNDGTPGAVNSTLPPSTSYTIFEIQSDVDGSGNSNTVGEFVTTSGIVTAIYPGEGVFTIQDGTGPFSGIWVEGTGVSLGDEVDVTGTVIEDFGNTIISPAALISVLTSGNPLPATEVLSTSAMNDEQWEGVLLETTGIVQNGDVGFGEWSIDDGSGLALVDDYGINVIPVDEGIQYTVVGPSLYSFGNWKFEPRDLNDIQRWGCTDDSFLNYDAAAVIDDGSCSNTPGCTDPEADNYDASAGIEDGSCIYSGCTDDTALNYDAQADNDDGSCYFTLPNLVINEIHYNPCVVQGDDFDWEFMEIYNADASTVNLEGFTFTNGFEFTFPAGATIAAGEYIIIAVNAASYSGNGYQVFEMATGNLSNGGETLTLEDGFGNVIDEVTYSNASPWPFSPDGSCVSLELIDPALDNTDGNNWQGSFVFDGTPGAQNSQQISGCTDPTACNYDPAANDDDGSCDLVSCLGCTYEDADNYDASATVDDGSCTFSNDCPADLNEDGLVNSADLLDFLGQFGTACP